MLVIPILTQLFDNPTLFMSLGQGRKYAKEQTQGQYPNFQCTRLSVRREK